jgi:hypothetical protein
MKFTIWDIEGIWLKVGVCARARSGKKKKKRKRKRKNYHLHVREIEL